MTRQADAPSPRLWSLARLSPMLVVSGIGVACAFLLLTRTTRHPFVIVLEQVSLASIGAMLFCFRSERPHVGRAIGMLAWVPILVVLATGFHELTIIDTFDPLRFLDFTTWLVSPIVLVSAHAAILGAHPSTLRTGTWAATGSWTTAILCHPGVLDGGTLEASATTVRTLVFGVAAVAATFMVIERVAQHRRLLGRITLGVLVTCELVRWIEAASAWPRHAGPFAGGSIVVGYQLLLALPLTQLIRADDRA